MWELGNTTLLGPTRDLCTRLSGLGAQQSVLISLPDDPNACQRSRTTGLSLSELSISWQWALIQQLLYDSCGPNEIEQTDL